MGPLCGSGNCDPDHISADPLSPALSQYNSLFGGGPRYDGTATVKNLTGLSCPPFTVSRVKGKTSEAVFRARVKTTQTAEAMSVSLPMAGAALRVVESDGYFKGRNKKLKANFIIDAWPAAAKNGSVANLTFSPAAPGPRDRFPEALNPSGGRGAGWFTSAPRVCLAPDNSFLQSS